jgi:hypothetical protein
LPSVNYREAAELISGKYVFKGPVVRRLSAEQFSDAVSQVIGPVYYAVAYSPESVEFSTNRIWHREVKFDRDVLPEPGDRYFRYVFTLENLPIQQAPLLISVDHSYELFINGKPVSSGNDWRKVAKLGVAGHLQTGENVIALKGTNEGNIANPAGILLAMKVIGDIDTLMITSGTDWKSTDKKPSPEWTSLGYDDTDWIQVKNYGSKHWDQLVDLNFTDTETPFARASLVQQHPFMKALGRPTRENVATTRADQATLLQALELTNGVYFNNVLADGADRWLKQYDGNPEIIATSLFEKAFGRDPDSREMNIIISALGENPDVESVQDVFWVTVLSPEFQFIY